MKVYSLLVFWDINDQIQAKVDQVSTNLEHIRNRMLDLIKNVNSQYYEQRKDPNTQKLVLDGKENGRWTCVNDKFFYHMHIESHELEQ